MQFLLIYSLPVKSVPKLLTIKLLSWKDEFLNAFESSLSVRQHYILCGSYISALTHISQFIVLSFESSGLIFSLISMYSKCFPWLGFPVDSDLNISSKKYKCYSKFRAIMMAENSFLYFKVLERKVRKSHMLFKPSIYEPCFLSRTLELCFAV